MSSTSLTRPAPSARRIRALARRTPEAFRPQLLRLAAEIEANPREPVRIVFTRRGGGLDIETGAALLVELQRYLCCTKYLTESSNGVILDDFKSV